MSARLAADRKQASYTNSAVVNSLLSPARCPCSAMQCHASMLNFINVLSLSEQPHLRRPPLASTWSCRSLERHTAMAKRQLARAGQGWPGLAKAIVFFPLFECIKISCCWQVARAANSTGNASRGHDSHIVYLRNQQIPSQGQCAHHSHFWPARAREQGLTDARSVSGMVGLPLPIRTSCTACEGLRFCSITACDRCWCLTGSDFQ